MVSEGSWRGGVGSAGVHAGWHDCISNGTASSPSAVRRMPPRLIVRNSRLTTITWYSPSEPGGRQRRGSCSGRASPRQGGAGPSAAGVDEGGVHELLELAADRMGAAREQLGH